MTVVQNINEDSFDEFIGQRLVTVLCFSAKWCAPCKSFEQICQQVAPSFEDVDFAKIDIEASPRLAEEFAVRSVPFIMILRHRTVVYADSGVLTHEDLVNMLKLALAMKKDELQGASNEESDAQ